MYCIIYTEGQPESAAVRYVLQAEIDNIRLNPPLDPHPHSKPGDVPRISPDDRRPYRINPFLA